ncbi:DUF7526 family protein [Halogeometricum luteum]|uniref:DUF7526 family protein n=1 Tax=Halogeometricum luteum TaxID=2950537 RepID=UPI003CCDF310
MLASACRRCFKFRNGGHLLAPATSRAFIHRHSVEAVTIVTAYSSDEGDEVTCVSRKRSYRVSPSQTTQVNTSPFE